MNITCPSCQKTHNNDEIIELDKRKDEKARLVFSCKCGSQFGFKNSEYLANRGNKDHVFQGIPRGKDASPENEGNNLGWFILAAIVIGAVIYFMQ